jgi:hypothetical protein
MPRAAAIAPLIVLAVWSLLPASASAQRGNGDSPEAKAVAFLVREVPRWRKEHPCYSCHNNGDAARALIVAGQRGHDVATALDDTLAWLRQPARWNEKMPQGGIDDKPLARIQFASALRLAVSNGRAAPTALHEAAGYVAADQGNDGSWPLDSSQSLGSPTTYGAVLATAAALNVLRAANRRDLQPSIDKGDAWLRGLTIETVLDAAAVLLGVQRATDESARRQRARALEIIGKGQSRDGGWGPYVTSPPQVFDTALVLLALGGQGGADRASAIARGRAYLVAQQLEDGSWPETTRPANQESYAQRISTTGWALLALLASPQR